MILFISSIVVYLLWYFSMLYIFNISIIKSSILEMSESIKVVVRVRPMNTKQIQRGCNSIVAVDQDRNQISLTKPDEPENIKNFAFDNVFGVKSQQDIVYTKTAYNLVQNVLLGYNGTIFAYGQTGCGKTHSMVGKIEDEQLQGIIPRSFGHILQTISQTKDKEFLIRCSFIQIYNEQVRDLLGKDVKNKLQVKESADKGIFIKDLSMNTAKTHGQLMEYMNIGNKSRTVGQTAMNKDSSRSHLLFMLYLESAQKTQSEEKKYTASKLNLVDLAGSQRLSKTGAQGDRLKQAQKINLSLSALGNVISALVDGKSHHIPYRDSKLTRLLQDSLGGNTKTVMIANCSPADYNFDQTLSTLRYASRAKFIKNKPIINEDPKDALLKQYAEQIKQLKMMLQGSKGGQGIDFNILQQQKVTHQQINAKLKQKEDQLTNEKLEKQKLRQKINQLQARHLQAKDVHIDENLKRNVQNARISIQQNMQKSKNFEKEKEDEEKQLDLDKNINNSNSKQVAEKYKNMLKKYKAKIKCLELELKDINHENYLDKQILLEDVRSITKQNKLLEGIINIMLLPNQFQTVKENSQYNEEKQEYRIPPFYMKNKQIIFPKLNENHSMEIIRKMQQNRNILWDKDLKKNEKDKEKDQPFKNNKNALNFDYPKIQHKKSDNCIRDVIRQAREHQNSPPFKEKDQAKNYRKLQLDPIKKLQKTENV